MRNKQQRKNVLLAILATVQVILIVIAYGATLTTNEVVIPTIVTLENHRHAQQGPIYLKEAGIDSARTYFYCVMIYPAGQKMDWKDHREHISSFTSLEEAKELFLEMKAQYTVQQPITSTSTEGSLGWLIVIFWIAQCVTIFGFMIVYPNMMIDTIEQLSIVRRKLFGIDEAENV